MLTTDRLVQARGSASANIDRCNQKIAKLEKWLCEERKSKAHAAEFPKESPDLRDMPRDLTDKIALRMITTTVEWKRLHRKKFSRLGITLDPILKTHVSFEFYNGIKYMHARLPEEMVDLI